MVYIFFNANKRQSAQINIDLRAAGYVLAYSATREMYFVRVNTVTDFNVVGNILMLNGVLGA